MNLVIVESPTKARTIGKFLGKDYQIEASMGHLVDLPKSKLGVDVEHNFSPQYEMVAAKEGIIKSLKDEAKKAQKIILATDPDREGEAIASHIKDVLGSSAPFQRIVFHEITESAIKEALDNPRDIDTNLVNAQTARRVLDRLVGYKLSPLLWMKVRRGLSAGRVQSIALRLIIEREREIERFKIAPYFRIKALFKDIPFDLGEINNEKVEIFEVHQLYDGECRVGKTVIDSQEKADQILQNIKKQEFIVSDVLEKEVRRTPPPPFTTSTLQQEAARRLGFSGKKTMTLAQKLYEGGFITYHRTDSVNIANQALFAIRDFIKKEFGEKFLPEKPRFYKTKQKLAQEAHEAIRPTHVGELQTQIAKLKSQIGNDTVRLYELVWRRAVASQMAEAVIESTTVYADTHPRGVPQAQHHLGGGRMDSPEVNFYRFKATGSVLIFEGFLKVNPQALEDKKLPKFKVSDLLDLQNINAEIHETEPPPRYNHASLVATLEEKGIGRPSTYASIIETIENRRYIEKDPSTLRQAQGSGRFIPTPVGIAVNDFLVANFSDIDDIPFTAEMEDSFDAIAHGKKKWEPVIRDFYIPFEKKFEAVKKAKRVEIAVEKTDQICEKCGKAIVIRMGRFGRFLSCSQFPKCDFKKALVQETNLICPKDQGKIIIKKTRRGRKFYGCYNYPKCDFAAWKLSDITSSKTKR